MHFAGESQSEREHFRSIILFGRNVASYKFALGKSLLELASAGNELVLLEDLAVPFARNICEHLTVIDRQGTFERSRFLDACRFFNAGRIDADELRASTVLLGFNNVIDAFHVVGAGDVPTRFFIDERSHGRIRLTESLLELAQHPEAADLTAETEARWRLVEEAWDGRAAGRQVTVLYDAPTELLVPALLGKRRSITEVRPALNGYQKGHCFYCFGPIHLFAIDTEAPEVDHVFPHVLMSRGLPIDLDSPWNLVLACSTCNRGPAGKFASLPHDRYLQRLYRRNEFLIGSNHPLRETLIAATGAHPPARRTFLLETLELAQTIRTGRSAWTATDEGEPLF